MRTKPPPECRTHRYSDPTLTVWLLLEREDLLDRATPRPGCTLRSAQAPASLRARTAPAPGNPHCRRHTATDQASSTAWPLPVPDDATRSAVSAAPRRQLPDLETQPAAVGHRRW